MKKLLSFFVLILICNVANLQSQYQPVSGTTAFSGSTIKIFNVKTDYGAKGDGSTDDTTAIQNAINAAGAASGGTIYYPNGVYIIGGALQDTGGANSQLTLPSVVAPGTQQYTIRFLGESPVSQIPWFLASTAGNTPSSGVVIKSTLSSGTGALISGFTATGFQNFTNVTFVAQNIDFRTVTNPTNSALDPSHVNSVVLEDCVVDSGNWIGNTIIQPTTATSYGIKLPRNSNGGNVYLNRVQVIGFYTGILNGEHAVGDQVEIYHCNVAMENAFAYHSSQYNRLLYANCVRGMKWTGVHYINVRMFDIEHTNQAVWYATTYDIDDGSNNGHGFITYHIVLSGTGVTNSALVNGGSNLALNPSDLPNPNFALLNSINTFTKRQTLSGGGGTNAGIGMTGFTGAGVIDFSQAVPADASYGPDAALYSDGNYLVLNSKTGANPLYFNFDNNNAGATVNIFHGNAIFTQPGALTLATDLTARYLYGNNASFLARNKTTLSNGAAAGAGTLTNAPASGNPTKWIPIDDNGVTRYIPSW